MIQPLRDDLMVQQQLPAHAQDQRARICRHFDSFVWAVSSNKTQTVIEHGPGLWHTTQILKLIILERCAFRDPFNTKEEDYVHSPANE